MSSFFDPYIGYVPSGQLLIGKDPTVNWEAIGFGANGRPNTMGTMTINICSSGEGIVTKLGTIQLAAGDILSIIKANPNAPKNFSLSLQEAAICVDSGDGNVQEMRMVILGSQIYPPAS